MGQVKKQLGDLPRISLKNVISFFTGLPYRLFPFSEKENKGKIGGK